MSRFRRHWIPGCVASCLMLAAVAAAGGSGRPEDPADGAAHTPAGAISTPRLTPGTRVRIGAPSLREKPYVGEVVDFQDNILTLKPDRSRKGHKLEAIPRSEITSLEISVDRKGHTAMGALIGLIVGGAGMAVAIGASGGSDGADDLAAAAIGLGAAVGAGLGAVAGATMKSDQWQAVGPGGVHVGVGATRGGGFGVQVQLAFGGGQ